MKDKAETLKKMYDWPLSITANLRIYFLIANFYEDCDRLRQIMARRYAGEATAVPPIYEEGGLFDAEFGVAGNVDVGG